MATSNIETTSSIKIWIQACAAIEKCEIESLKGNVSFVESEIIPTVSTEDNNMYFLETVPRQFIGNGRDNLWVYIDNTNSLRKKNILPIHTIDFLLLVAEGKMPGYSIVHKFGKNPSVSTTVFDTIWNGGGEYTGFNAISAETVTITSTNANDTLLGSGLRTIRLFGLDANFEQQSEDIELNGTNSVISTLEFIRLDTAKGLSSGGGTFGSNLGDIVIRQSVTTANIFAVIPISYGTTMIAAYTVPSDKKGYIIAQASSIANKQSASIDIRIKAKTPGSVFIVFGEAALNSQGTGFIERKFETPGELPPMTDIFIEAIASSDVAVSAFIDILLVDQ